MAVSNVIDLLAATAINSDAAATAVDGLLRYHSLYGLINCSAVPTGATNTLDVYIQTSPDGGTSWRDIAHTQFTTVVLKRYFSIAGLAAGSTSIIAASDGALAGETVVQGPWGDQLRVKYDFTVGDSSGTYTLAVKVVGKGGS